ncbi:hypothetical protein KAR91_03920 [Candidatus Pacearchaeota archaeon]|nr:hypothetical protein [Candidatus Pacearchaeota archaeon]
MATIVITIETPDVPFPEVDVAEVLDRLAERVTIYGIKDYQLNNKNGDDVGEMTVADLKEL